MHERVSVWQKKLQLSFNKLSSANLRAPKKENYVYFLKQKVSKNVISIWNTYNMFLNGDFIYLFILYIF